MSPARAESDPDTQAVSIATNGASMRRERAPAAACIMNV